MLLPAAAPRPSAGSGIETVAREEIAEDFWFMTPVCALADGARVHETIGDHRAAAEHCTLAATVPYCFKTCAVRKLIVAARRGSGAASRSAGTLSG
ncbi:hypothetical protein GCM10020367_05460 [Streptomyces sannanensis]|uniref:Uncharacterized protein n=1 Tax=Streptomyces sannanensis TaxID=285536 RepID=A0ABP6S4Y9_9ACTN